MKKFLIIVLMFQTGLMFGQDISFDKANFKDQKDGFKVAKQDYETGMDFIRDAEKYMDPSISTLRNFEDYQTPYYRQARPFLERAYQFNPNSSLLNYHLGKCHLVSQNKLGAIDFLLKAYRLNPSVALDIQFYIGYAYHLNMNWTEAKKYYELYRSKVSAANDYVNLEQVNKKLMECTYGEKLTQKPVRVWIDNAGPNVNTRFPEYTPLITVDESAMIFTGRRDDTYKGGVDPQDEKYYEDIYESRKGPDGEWQKAVNLGPPINTQYHEAPAGLSPDGKLLFIFNGQGGGGGDLMTSTYINGSYSKPEKLPSQISGNSTYESSASISYDGKELYFTSGTSYGKEDIFVCKWDEKKKAWGTPQNLGEVVNTKYRETGVFLHPDGETMYFSSEGHESMGGFDIFMTKRVNGVWTKPVNVGYPINSVDDDIFFVVAGSGRHAYFASIREGGYGEADIYRITFLGPEKLPQTSSEDRLLANFKPVREVKMEPKVEVSTASLTVLKGIVRDEKTKLPLLASLELVDNERNEVIATFSTDATSGRFLVSIPSGKNYGIAVKSDGYLFHSENIDIPKSSGFREYEKEIELKKIDVGEVIVLRNIFFDFDKSTLRSESTNELERLVKLMKDNPTLRIEISGHTDHQGSEDYNQKLSESRAASVVTYLVEKGIARDRLEYKGYGESKPEISEDEIAKMKTKLEKDEANQQNRRTEFKILSK